LNTDSLQIEYKLITIYLQLKSDYKLIFE